MVFTWVPPLAGWCARTAAQKSATTAAASSSPCASVSAVKPAMSANTKVALAGYTASADMRSATARLRAIQWRTQSRRYMSGAAEATEKRAPAWTPIGA
jgi:hypothetical protein